MKIIPLFKWMKDNPFDPARDRFEGMYPRKTMLLVLAGTETFPVGTPDFDAESGVCSFRGQVQHFHCAYNSDGTWEMVPEGVQPNGFAIASAKRLGRGRKMLRKFLAKYPPVDKCKQAHDLRNLVRTGD